MKNKYLIVLHCWFVESKGFHVYEIDADSYEEASAKADTLQLGHTETFSHCARTIIMIQKNLPPRKRKLTWLERIMGSAAL